MITLTYDLSTIDQVAQKILNQASQCKIITLTGALGAGKTTLTGAMLKQLGVLDPVISPTFTYFNQYQTQSGLLVYHFDLYRLKSVQEFEHLGFTEYLDQPNSLVIIEWPEIIQSILKCDVLWVDIQNVNNQSRIIHWRKI